MPIRYTPFMWIVLQVMSVSLWAWINVLDSLLVRHFEKRAFVMMWYQSIFSVTVLALFAATRDLSTPWMIPLALSGVISYAGDIIFFTALRRIDVSVTNVAWSFLAVFLSAIGMFHLHEFWTTMQWAGVCLVFGGVLVLSLWHRTIGRPLHLLLLPLLGLLYVPYYFTEKSALLSGQQILPVFFWPVFARELSSFVCGLALPTVRRAVHGTSARLQPAFHMLNAVVIVLFLSASYLTAQAYRVGPLSLVSVVGNVQPFFVLVFAGLVVLLKPAFAPKEVLTMQSMGVKALSFIAVFVGLALLTIADIANVPLL